MSKRKIYIAYGSNMMVDQMVYRCPEASLVGTGYIDGYELLFKGSLTGSYATIEPADGARVPVYIWEITEADERNLDYYEGFPRFYDKHDIEVYSDADQATITGMVYIMTPGARSGIPSKEYFNGIMEVYEENGWDAQPMWDGLDISIEHMRAEARRWG